MHAAFTRGPGALAPRTSALVAALLVAASLTVAVAVGSATPSAGTAAAAAPVAPAPGSSCELMPIALAESTLAGVEPGTVLRDVANGGGPGNYGWLAWGIDNGVPALVAALTPPGTSGSYVDPDDATDRRVSVGDRVRGRPGVANAKQVRDALDRLRQRDVAVPTWDVATGNGADLKYRVADFALLRLLDYELAGQNRISARFLGRRECSPPADDRIEVDTDEDTPVTVTLSASDADSPSLTFEVSPAEHGDVDVPTPPRCTTASGTTTCTSTVTYTPASGYSGHDRFTYVAHDGALSSRAVPVDVTIRPVNDPPTAADISVATDEDAPLALTLAGTDPDGDPLSYTVVDGPDHGVLDPPAAPGAATRTYRPAADFAGSDTFTYRAGDATAESNTAGVTVAVRPVPDAPEITSLPVLRVTEGEAYAYDVDATDVDAQDALTFSLTARPAGMTIDPATGEIAWTARGTEADVTVRVEDGAGLADTQSFTIAVDPGPRPPIARDDDLDGIDAREDVVLAIPAAALLANDSDPDGDSLTIAEVAATPDTHGTVELDGSSVRYTPDADHNGPVAFTYLASDGGLASNPARVRLTVQAVNDAPVPADDDAATVGETLTIASAELTANDRPGALDEAGQTLVVTDAAPLPATRGSVAMFLGDVVYTPAPGYSGPDSFAYTVCDDGTTAGSPDPRCAGATVRVDVTAAPRPPVAEDLTLTGDEDAPLDLALRASDPDGDALTFEIVDGPDHGTLSPAADGPAERRYAPDADANGLDRFTYRASDGALRSNLATVAIAVREVNDPPIAAPDVKRVDGRSISFPAADLLIGDSAGPPNESSQALFVTRLVSSPDTHGDVTLVLGTVTYTAEAGFNGDASFRYEVCDDGTSAGAADPRCQVGTVTLSVTQAPAAPVADDVAVTTDEDEPASVTLSATDPSADPLTYAIVDGPAHGGVVPPGPGAAARTYAPDAHFHGSDTFTYRANDGSADSNVATVTVTVRPVNDPPVAVTDDKRAARDAPLRFPASDLVANDSPGPANEASQALAVAAVTAGADTHGTVALAGGDVTYTPDAGFLGEAALTYRVCDDGETAGSPDPRCADGSVHMTVAEAALDEIAVEPASRTIAGGETVQYTATGTFTDGTIRDVTDAVTWTSSDPAVANITPAGSARGGEPGTTTVTAERDGVSATASLTVTDAELRSIVVEPQDPTILVGDTQAFQATGVLSDGTSESLGAQVAWSSETPEIASIEPGGTATAVGEGTTTISATKDGVNGTSLLTVRPRIADAGLPTAVISSPADNAEVTSPEDVVGTATDANFLKYVLAIAPAGETSFTTIEESTTAVSDGVLGRFDPTLLRNDLYTVRLTVYDLGGNTSTATRTWQVARDQKVGNFSIAFEDLQVPLSGLAISVNRLYDTRDKGVGDFGFGWRLHIQTLRVRSNRVQGTGWRVTRSSGFFPTYTLVPSGDHKVSVTLPDGRVEEFDLVPNPSSSVLLPLQFIAAEYRPRSGTVGTLRPISNPGIYVSGAQPGEVELLDDGDFDVYDPQVFEYTAADGTVYVIDKRLGVQSARDSNGNTLTFSSAGIMHSSGVGVTFTRDARGRITAITDPEGNVSRYAYDARGDLAAYTDPAGNRTTFSYNRSHGLLEIRDPRGFQAARNEYDDEGRLVAIVDAAGNRTRYEHDLEGRREIIRDRRGHATVLVYDDDGNVLSKTDPLGRTTTRTYDARGNELTVTDPLGNTTRLTYDAHNNVVRQEDPTGAVVTKTYDGRGQVLTDTDANGATTVNAYDAAGNLLSSTDGEGDVTRHSYDGRGNRLTSTDPAGNEFRYAYDGAGSMLSHTSATGAITTFEHDANGNRLRETKTRTDGDGTARSVVATTSYDGRNRPLETIDGVGAVTRMEYSPTGQVAAMEDPNGGRTTHAFDAIGRLVRTTFPDGTSQSSSYDADGNRIASIDRAGRRTTYEFDALSRVVRTTHPDATAVGTEYDEAGRVSARTDARGNRTRMEHDGAGRLVRVIDPSGATTTYGYDAAGNRVRETDPRGHVTTFDYDEDMRLLRTTFADGTSRSSTWDAAGRRSTATDEAGLQTSFGYDAAGRLTRVTDALAGVTAFGYDEVGNLMSIADARGNRTRLDYDDAGRLVARTLPMGEVETFGYDTGGNPTRHTDFGGATTTRTYDELNRLVAEDRPDGDVSYGYTPTGLPAEVDDASGETRYAYDDRDRLVRVDEPDGLSVGYGYDADGNRTSLTSPAGTVTYDYDEVGNLLAVGDPAGDETRYGYDADRNRISATLPNGTRTAYDYDSRHRLTGVRHARADDTVIGSYDYTLDATGRRQAVTEAGGRAVRYSYDALYRLTEEDVTDPSAGDRLERYTYDAVGNRLTASSGATTTSYAYDANDRLLTAGATSYDYDDNGNLVRRTGPGSEIATFEYDSTNRIVASTAPDGTGARFGYDAAGNRTSVTTGGRTTRYLLDANGRLARVLEERRSDGSDPAHYVFGDSLVSRRRGATTSWYHHDALGSTRALTDTSGATTDAYAYDAFGGDAGSSGSTANDFRFAGEQLVPELGAYNLRARHYDPATGRFHSLDPLLVGRTDQPPALHRYAYANGDPVNNVDPAGQMAMVSMTMTMPTISISTVISFAALRAAFLVVAKMAVVACAVNSVVSKVTALGSGLPCDVTKYNVLYPGLVDTPKTTEHIAEAIAGRPGLANLTKGTNNAPTRRWYKDYPECVGASKDAYCDEYPFYSTKEGGPGASLKLVPAYEQFPLQATYLRMFYAACKIIADDRYEGAFGVVPGRMPITNWDCK